MPMKVSTFQTFAFSFEVNGRSYNFSIVAATIDEARMKLNDDLIAMQADVSSRAAADTRKGH